MSAASERAKKIVEETKEKFKGMRQRFAAKAEKAKNTAKVLGGAAAGGGLHGGIKAKTRGKNLGSFAYQQVATAGVVVLSFSNDDALGPAAGMVGAEASNAVEAAVDRAAANQGQQKAAAPALMVAPRAAALPAPQARVAGVNDPVGNVVFMPRR